MLVMVLAQLNVQVESSSISSPPEDLLVIILPSSLTALAVLSNHIVCKMVDIT